MLKLKIKFFILLGLCLQILFAFGQLFANRAQLVLILSNLGLNNTLHSLFLILTVRMSNQIRFGNIDHIALEVKQRLIQCSLLFFFLGLLLLEFVDH